MNKAFIAVIVILVLVATGFGGWYLFIKKSPEGGSCTSNSHCEENLNCFNKTCSSGKLGSACGVKNDCETGYCANTKCTEGQKGSPCATYKDCQSGLLCQKSVCSTPPDYSKYFKNVTISKMKAGMPPGPNNPLMATTEFKSGDGIEIDFAGVTSEAKGKLKYEIANSTTGEVVVTSENRGEVPDFAGRDFGTGTDLSAPAGSYDLNLYLNGEMVFTTPITVS